MPLLVVFQTPPAAVPTYQVDLSVGWTAMSAIRPLVRAGPIDRSLRPETTDESLTESVGVCAAETVVARARRASVRMPKATVRPG